MDLSSHRFSKSHEWAAEQPSATRIGITDYAQSQLGDVIYVELPAIGAEVSAGGKFGVVESVKAASDLYSPVSGKVTGVNGDLQSRPELINTDPYGGGWMLELELTAPASAELLDEAAYKSFVQGL